MEERTLWLHIEPSTAGERLLKPAHGNTPVKQKEEASALLKARRTIETLAEIVDRLDTFAVAEVDIIDSEHDVEEAGLMGYELGIYLDALANEEERDPGEMFGAVYMLLDLLMESGLYDAELTLDEEERSVEEMLELVTELAEDAGYYVGPETRAPEPEAAKPKKGKSLGKDEAFFLEASGLKWPCASLALRRQWKILAARFHPDSRTADAASFRLAKDGYDKLKARLTSN